MWGAGAYSSSLLSSSSCAGKPSKSSSSVSELNSWRITSTLTYCQYHFGSETNPDLGCLLHCAAVQLLENLIMVDFLRLLNAVRIHWQTWAKVALRMQPVLVYDFSPQVIQASHSAWSATLNAGLTLMSSGCRYFFVPPGQYSWNWFGPLGGCFHRICFVGPHAVQNEQCYFLWKKSSQSLGIAT